MSLIQRNNKVIYKPFFYGIERKCLRCQMQTGQDCKLCMICKNKLQGMWVAENEPKLHFQYCARCKYQKQEHEIHMLCFDCREQLENIWTISFLEWLKAKHPTRLRQFVCGCWSKNNFYHQCKTHKGENSIWVEDGQYLVETEIS